MMLMVLVVMFVLLNCHIVSIKSVLFIPKPNASFADTVRPNIKKKKAQITLYYYFCNAKFHK